MLALLSGGRRHKFSLLSRASPGLVQRAAVWRAGEPAEEGSVCAERCCSSAYQHTASRPHHSGFASTPLAASTATSGVQDCMSGTPIAYVNCTDVQYLSADIQLVSEHGRRHLRSSSYRTLAVPRTRTTLGDRSFAVAGSRVWNSLPATIRQITSYGQFRQHLKTHLFRA